jgi:hypothetical protein
MEVGWKRKLRCEQGPWRGVFNASVKKQVTRYYYSELFGGTTTTRKQCSFPFRAQRDRRPLLKTPRMHMQNSISRAISFHGGRKGSPASKHPRMAHHNSHFPAVFPQTVNAPFRVRWHAMYVSPISRQSIEEALAYRRAAEARNAIRRADLALELVVVRELFVCERKVS